MQPTVRLQHSAVHLWRQERSDMHFTPIPTLQIFRVTELSTATAAAYVFGGLDEQRIRLEKEGVEVNEENMVDLQKFLWQP